MDSDLLRNQRLQRNRIEDDFLADDMLFTAGEKSRPPPNSSKGRGIYGGFQQELQDQPERDINGGYVDGSGRQTGKFGGGDGR